MQTSAMTETEADRRVADAIEHLRAFARSVESGQTIDPSSQLTGEDIKIVVNVFDDVFDKDYGFIKKNTV